MPIPSLFPGWWERFIYYLFEPCWWSIWYRHSRSVHGDLPDVPMVLVANHGSYLDWLLLHVVLRRKFHRKIRFLAKEKVVRNPLFRVLVHATESIVVDESKKLKAAVLATKVFSEAAAGANPIVGIFPEGTRSKDGQPLPAISGASWIARKAGVPILPVALCGFWEAWPPATPLPCWKRKHLGIHFLKPINPADFPDDQAATDFALSEIYSVVLRERAAAQQAGGR